MKPYLSKLPFAIFALSFFATVGSLTASEILLLPPCDLCWWQRIFMYPIAIITTIAIVRKEVKHFVYYVLPFSIIGWLISIYHNLLYYHILPESLAPCQQGISCTTKQLEWFGFFTIPLGSFLVFTFILICSIIYSLSLREKRSNPVQKTRSPRR